MKRFFDDYMNDKIKLDKYQKLGVFSFILLTSGLFGWIYEFVFYFFNSGMKTWYMRGGNFLPWINIYAIGAFLIIIICTKFKKKPWLVFILSVIITGLLEYFSGLVIFKLIGARYWDYNTEILNFGNIGGFVCLISIFIITIIFLDQIYNLILVDMFNLKNAIQIYKTYGIKYM